MSSSQKQSVNKLENNFNQVKNSIQNFSNLVENLDSRLKLIEQSLMAKLTSIEDNLKNIKVNSSVIKQNIQPLKVPVRLLKKKYKFIFKNQTLKEILRVQVFKISNNSVDCILKNNSILYFNNLILNLEKDNSLDKKTNFGNISKEAFNFRNGLHFCSIFQIFYLQKIFYPFCKPMIKTNVGSNLSNRTHPILNINESQIEINASSSVNPKKLLNLTSNFTY